MINSTLDQTKPAHPQEFVFLLLPGFTHLALSASIEVLRVANLLSGQTLYRWALMTETGASAESSNGLVTAVHQSLQPLRKGTELFVVAGVDVEQRIQRSLLHYLRQQSRHGVEVGAICSGAVVLAEGGLLSRKSCTVHWHYYPLIRERYGDISLSYDAFFARSRPYTASGGTAGGELMLAMVAQAQGEEFARQVADQLVLAEVRTAGDAQRMPHHVRYQTRNRIFLEALEFMHANVEDPLSTLEIAGHLNVSVRQLERVFRKVIGQSPTRHYREIRLEHARKLLETTDLSIIQIALSSGFSSSSHFSKVYRAHFGVTPFHSTRVPSATGSPA